MTPRSNSVEVKGLVKRYGDLTAVDDVSFAVDGGSVFALLGPNGAGKTTTIEMIEGLRARDSGHVRVMGRDPSEGRRFAENIGVMLQDADLYAGIRTEEALRLFASFYDDADDPDALIDRLDLGRVRKTAYRRLSGGERKRLALAIALVGRPKVAFLDEPTAGMDIEGRVEAWELVEQLRNTGTAVVLTTHLLDEAERVADKVAIIHRGKIVASGATSDLTKSDDGELTFSLSKELGPQEIGAAIGRMVTNDGPETYRAEGGPPDPELVAELSAYCAQHGVLITRLDVGRRSLADVYLELTRDR